MRNLSETIVFIVLVVFVVFLALAVSGCAITSVEEAYNKTKIKTDEFTGVTNIISPSHEPPLPMRKGNVETNLRARIEDSSIIYNLYVEDRLSGWRFYEEVYDSEQNKLLFVPIDRWTISADWLYEIFAIGFTRSYLEEHKKDGLNLKFIGQRYDRKYKLPGLYIEGFLQKVDEYEAKHNLSLDEPYATLLNVDKSFQKDLKNSTQALFD